MSRYKPYQSYKDSGVEWLGEVPAHWQSIKFKHILFEKKKETNIDLNCGSISFGEVVFKDDEKIPEETKASYQEVLAGEFLVNPLNLNYDLKSLRTALSKIDVVVSSGYIVLKSHEDANKNYLRWLLYQFDVAHMKTLGSGVRQTINYADIGNSYFLEPIPDEQIAIANFLDRETAKIDTLIAKQDRMIELLGEKRSAIISHAVTKGLDSNVKMKDSGVEWLGEVPEHWEIKKMKHVIKKIESGTSVNASNEPASVTEFGVLKTSCVYTGQFDPNENKTVIPEEIMRLSCPLQENTLIVSRMNTPDLVGAAGLVTFAPKNIYLPDRLWQVSFDFAVPAFIHYLTLTGVYRSYIQTVCAGTSSSMQNLSQDNFRDFTFALPDNQEQRVIADYLCTQTAKIDTLIAKARQAIELMKERRIALISAAVTGKIDVRGIQS